MPVRIKVSLLGMCVAVLSLLALSVVTSGCGTPSLVGTGGNAGAGARSGGAQDIGLARSKVAAGTVPDAIDFPSEGLFAESDIPVSGAACNQTLCISTGSGVTPVGLPGPDDAGVVDASDTTSWVHLGLSSNIDLANFHRQPLNAALIIDKSGSMNGGKLEAVKTAAEKFVDQLNDDDLLTIVEFDDTANTLIGPEAVTDREKFKAQIRRIQVAGGTCIECGLKSGFAAVDARLDATRSSRVFLLTDALPNIGKTDFMSLMTTNAEKNIAATVFGVGLDFGQETVTKLQSIRGANYFFLKDEERMRTIFDTDFDLMVTPVAFDLQLKLTPSPGVTFNAVHGVPGASETRTIDSTVKTVFLSRTHGALVGQLSGVAPSAPIALASLSFQPVTGAAISNEVEVRAPAGASPAYSNAGARKAATLTRYLIAARDACALFKSGDKVAAAAAIDGAVRLLNAEAIEMNDADLRREATFAGQLAALISK